MRNVVSCILRPQDLLRYVKEVANHEPILLSFVLTTATEDPKPKAGKSEQPPKSQQQQQQQQTKNNKASTKKAQTLLALQWKKSENYVI